MENHLREGSAFMFKDIEVCLPYVQGVVVDVGAHVGLWTVPLAKKAKKVIAIEANPYTCAQLLKNISDNIVSNVIVHNVVLGDTAVAYAQSKIGPTGTNHYRVGGNIQPKTLDSLITERVSFIKIDVEGMEPEVLAGAKKLIATSRPYFYIEVNPKMLRRGGKTPADISKYLISYKFYRLSEVGFVRLPFLLNSFYNFLAVPKELDQPKATGFLKYCILRHTKKSSVSNTRTNFV